MLERKLTARFPDFNWRFEVPWREITSLGVGSAPVPLLCDVTSEKELAELLEYCHHENIPRFILGGGTNICGCDAPVNFLVIRLAGSDFSAIECLPDGKTLRAGCGTKLAELARRAAANGFGGLAPLAGIPGTLGGALKMNAGANGTEIGQLVARVRGFMPDGSLKEFAGEAIQWRYRGNSLPEELLITDADLKLPPAGENEKDNISGEIERRRKSEPKGRSAGCAFRNVSALEPAGKLIDEAGLKGSVCGDLTVSEIHANYILNRGTASEEEYISLLKKIISRVRENTGFILRPEVKFANPATEKKLDQDICRPKVLVAMGGVSSEREVSLRSGAAVANALYNAGFNVDTEDVKTCAVSEKMRSCDVVYIMLHGGFGEDGRIQKVLEDAGIKFVGSGSSASRFFMDKIASKRGMDANRIPTAKWTVITPECPGIPENLNFPIVLKAPGEGSSVGVIKVERAEDWPKAIAGEFKYSNEILAEEFISGIEITVPVWNGTALPAVEIAPPHGFYTYDAKYVYHDGKTCYFCPARSLTPETEKMAAEYALEFFRAGNAKDILRVDFIVDSNGIPMALEGNTIPGSTATSLVPKSAAAAGISFEKLLTVLVLNHL